MLLKEEESGEERSGKLCLNRLQESGKSGLKTVPTSFDIHPFIPETLRGCLPRACHWAGQIRAQIVEKHSLVAEGWETK